MSSDENKELIKDVKKDDGTSVPMRKFDLNSMVEYPAVCMVAKRGSGKSFVCRAILRHFKDIPGGVIISGTDKVNPFYGEFVPELYIHYEYSSELIEKILHRQEIMIKKMKEKEKLGKKVDPRAFLVMDDCLADKGSWAKEKPIMELLFNGRHYRIMYILTMQFPLGIKPELRCNFDYVFLLAEDFYTQQKKLYDHYAGMFYNFKAFRDIFMSVTEDYGCMVINNRGSRKSLLDKVFWYKADDKDIGYVGSKQFKRFHKYNYNPNWQKVDKGFDDKEFFSKKKDIYKVNKLSVGNSHIN